MAAGFFPLFHITEGRTRDSSNGPQPSFASPSTFEDKLLYSEVDERTAARRHP